MESILLTEADRQSVAGDCNLSGEANVAAQNIMTVPAVVADKGRIRLGGAFRLPTKR